MTSDFQQKFEQNLDQDPEQDPEQELEQSTEQDPEQDPQYLLEQYLFLRSIPLLLAILRTIPSNEVEDYKYFIRESSLLEIIISKIDLPECLEKKGFPNIDIPILQLPIELLQPNLEPELYRNSLKFCETIDELLDTSIQYIFF